MPKLTPKLKQYLALKKQLNEAKNQPEMLFLKGLERFDEVSRETVKEMVQETMNMVRADAEARLVQLEDRINNSIPSLAVQAKEEVKAQILPDLEKMRGPKGEPGDKGEPGAAPTLKALRGLIKPLIPQPIKPTDGYTPTAGVDYPTKEEFKLMIKELVPKIPTKEIEAKINAIVDKLPTFEQVARGLETLKGKERLDYYALKNLPDIPTSRTLGAKGGGGMALVTITGTIDDSNTSFTADSEPKVVYANGQALVNGSGVTISGLAITLDNPLGTGGSIFGIR